MEGSVFPHMKKSMFLVCLMVLFFISGCASGGTSSISTSEDSSSGATSRSDTDSSDTVNSSGISGILADENDFVTVAQSEDWLYGYINIDGDWVIAPTYATAFTFTDNRATVCTEDGEWLIIDKRGQVIARLPEDIEIVTTDETTGKTIHQERIIIYKDGKYGFADTEGNIVVEPKYSYQPHDFSDGRALVNFADDSEKWGYIDRDGNTVVEGRFYDAWSFSGDYAHVYAHEEDEEVRTWQYIDTSGNAVITSKIGTDEFGSPYRYGVTDAESGFVDGLAVVDYAPEKSYESRLSIMDKSGNIIFSDSTGEYASIGRMTCKVISEGMYPVENDDGDIGFIDMTGAMVIAFQDQWNVDNAFHEGLCAVRMNGGGNAGYIDKSGNLVIEAKYALATDFSNGLAAVSEDGTEWYFIDKTGKTVLEKLGTTQYPFAK